MCLVSFPLFPGSYHWCLCAEDCVQDKMNPAWLSGTVKTEEPCGFEKLYLIHIGIYHLQCPPSILLLFVCLVSWLYNLVACIRRPVLHCWRLKTSLLDSFISSGLSFLQSSVFLFLELFFADIPSQLNHTSASCIFYIWLWGSDTCSKSTHHCSKSTRTLPLISHSVIGNKQIFIASSCHNSHQTT